MRVLVTGATGVLGSWLCRTVPTAVDLVAGWHRSQADPRLVSVRADLLDDREARRMLASVRPDLVVHAAYTRDHDGVVTQTRNVLEAADAVGAHVVHVSSDALFRGDGRCRGEDDEPDPVHDYGRAKAEAEELVRRGAVDPAIVRTSLLVSTSPPGHDVARVRDAAAGGLGLEWYRGERRQPVWAADVAETVWRITTLPPDRRAGVWHLPGPERLTRAELGRRIAAGLGVVDPGLEVDGPSVHERPRDVCLSDERARRDLGWDPSAVRWPGPVRS